MTNPAKLYQQNSERAMNMRDLEASLLLRAASRLNELLSTNAIADSHARESALAYNRKLWTILFASVCQRNHPLPLAVRSNIASIGRYVFSQSLVLLTDPDSEGIRSLIVINQNLAAGLMGKP